MRSPLAQNDKRYPEVPKLVPTRLFFHMHHALQCLRVYYRQRVHQLCSEYKQMRLSGGQCLRFSVLKHQTYKDQLNRHLELAPGLNRDRGSEDRYTGMSVTFSPPKSAAHVAQLTDSHESQHWRSKKLAGLPCRAPFGRPPPSGFGGSVCMLLGGWSGGFVPMGRASSSSPGFGTRSPGRSQVNP